MAIASGLAQGRFHFQVCTCANDLITDHNQLLVMYTVSFFINHQCNAAKVAAAALAINTSSSGVRVTASAKNK